MNIEKQFTLFHYYFISCIDIDLNKVQTFEYDMRASLTPLSTANIVVIKSRSQIDTQTEIILGR